MLKYWNIAGATIVGMLAAVLGLGHFPGWSPEIGEWLPIGDMAFEFMPVAMGAAAGLWQRDTKIPVKKGRLPQ